MAGFFALLWVISVFFLFIGLISPNTISKWLRKELSRKKIFGIFGSLFVGSFIAFGATVPTTPAPSIPSSAIRQVQKESLTTSTLTVATSTKAAIDDTEAKAVIQSFFTSLNNASFQEGYDLFGDGMKSGNPFFSWKGGYKNTLHQEISSVNCMEGNCDVVILATEVTSSSLKKVSYDFIYTLEKEEDSLSISSGRLVAQELVEELPKEPVAVIPVLQVEPEVTSIDPAIVKEETPQKTNNTGLSNNNYYTNSAGDTVHSPAHTTDNSVPAGASARCRDGTYSFSQSRRGTCSHHGGVDEWL